MGRDFDQIEALFLGKLERGGWRHGAEIPALFGDHDDFRGEDSLVHAVFRLDDDFWLGAMMPSASHGVSLKNLVELMGIAPMSREVFPK